MILYNKLYYIDKFGHKNIRKKMRPIYQSAKQSLPGIKKNEIIKVAQENLYMLKRLSEKTSYYDVEKMNRDYEASQYYKKNHCLHPPINFNKTQKIGKDKWGFIRKKFYSKTHYASMGQLDTPCTKMKISLKKKKKFDEYNYRDLNLVENNKSNEDIKNEKQFKKIAEIENVEKEEKKEDKENKKNIDNGNVQNKKEMEKEKKESGHEKKEDKNHEEEEKKHEEKEPEKEEKGEEGNEGIKEPKKNMRDEKEEKEGKEENGMEKDNEKVENKNENNL